MKSCLFERLALSRDKESVIALSREGLEVATPKDIIKDPFVLEFVGLPQDTVYKEGDLEHNDIGQMNMYLSYFKEEEGSEGGNEPIGIVLGRYKDQILVKYAMQGITNQLFISRYQLYLPNKE